VSDAANIVSDAASFPTPTPPPYAPVDTAQLPDVGQTVGGHCVLQKLLGEGAFGRVFAAEHAETGQQVALKVVGLRRYPREYAEHELRALAAIAHPNVVQLNEHGVEASALEPYLWYTMPLYKGSDLARTLKAEGSLSLSRAHAIFTRIAGGVCEMHNAGLRHQDIKPDNIYLATMAGVSEPHPVLLDLGGAARKDASRPLVATFPFAAPEQANALIGGLLGDRHAPLTEKVDVYALAATLLFALVGTELLGHDIGQSEADDTATPAGLVKLRSQLAIIHPMRAEDPLPAGTLPYVTGATREHLSKAFQRWLAPDAASRPSAAEFLDELGVLLEWDAEEAHKKAARQFRGTLLSIIGGLSIAACVGGFTGYQWHKRTMTAANEATSEALKKADDAADELQRAGSNLDKIVADPSLGPVEKAKKIGEVVASLEAQTSGLAAANAKLKSNATKAAELARFRAQQAKEAFDTALAKAEADRDTARQDKALADTARTQAETERDQAKRDKTTADSARLRAEADRDKAQQDKLTSDSARAKAEGERDKAQQEQNVAEAAKQRAEAERDKAQQDKAAAEAAAFARGVTAGAARVAPPNAPAPAGSN
jgi:eukaryotic-like serine/threonine-protein kinase